MRVSLINVHLFAQDAVAECLLNQARVFQRNGDELRIYVLFPPRGAPDSIAALTRVVDLDGIRRDAHFIESDLYVFHYPGIYPMLETIGAIDRGTVIFYYHNVTPPDLWGSEHERDLLERSLRAVRGLAAQSDLVVTPSPFNAEQLVNDHGADPGRIRVLPMAVDPGRFRPGPRDSTLARRHGPEGRRIILFVGRMAGNKRVDLLVEALPLVRRLVPDAALLLVGDDSSAPAFVENVARVRARAVELGVGAAVVFTGRVDELPPYYRLADVYATASLHEGFGVPILEAMASGVPVVASRAAAHPWVVGEAGLLAEAGDAHSLAEQIVRVLGDDELRGRLADRGLERVREFSLQRYEAAWTSIVGEAVAGVRWP